MPGFVSACPPAQGLASTGAGFWEVGVEGGEEFIFCFWLVGCRERRERKRSKRGRSERSVFPSTNAAIFFTSKVFFFHSRSLAPSLSGARPPSPVASHHNRLCSTPLNRPEGLCFAAFLVFLPSGQAKREKVNLLVCEQVPHLASLSAAVLRFAALQHPRAEPASRHGSSSQKLSLPGSDALQAFG